MNDTPCIGIDLGTTFSAVATAVEGEPPRIIPRRTGQRLLPSMVGFSPSGERVIGEQARFLAETFPENVAYAVKRFIGQRWSAELAARSKGQLPFGIVAGPTDDVRIKIAGRTLPVVQLSAMLLSELRLDAEAHYGKDVRRAVITVPANFNDAQRMATREAARIAGLDVLRLVNEPTAAALAYGLSTGFEGRALVFDLGGGTFDVSILEVRDGVFEVVATGGDPFLGGEDFDGVIVEWLLSRIDERARVRVQKHLISMARIKVAAEQAKRRLSSEPKADFSLELNPEGSKVKLEASLSLAEFEALVKVPAERCLSILDKVLQEGSIDRKQITAVLLVGGMTRVPLVRRLVTRHFGKEPESGLDPDEVVALGAAIHASALASQKGSVLLLDVVSNSLGVGIAGGLVKTLIEKNRALPCKVKETFFTSRDGQTTVRMPVTQGESRYVKDNASLGELTLEGLRSARRAELAIDVTFELGSDGILTVEALDTNSGKVQSASLLARTDLNETERQRFEKEERDHREAIRAPARRAAATPEAPKPGAPVKAEAPKPVAPPPPPAPRVDLEDAVDEAREEQNNDRTMIRSLADIEQAAKDMKRPDIEPAAKIATPPPPAPVEPVVEAAPVEHDPVVPAPRKDGPWAEESDDRDEAPASSGERTVIRSIAEIMAEGAARAADLKPAVEEEPPVAPMTPVTPAAAAALLKPLLDPEGLSMEPELPVAEPTVIRSIFEIKREARERNEPRAAAPAAEKRPEPLETNRVAGSIESALGGDEDDDDLIETGATAVLSSFELKALARAAQPAKSLGKEALADAVARSIFNAESASSGETPEAAPAAPVAEEQAAAEEKPAAKEEPKQEKKQGDLGGLGFSAVDEARIRLRRVIERLRLLREQLALAAEESGSSEAKAIVEAVGGQHERALKLLETGTADELDATAADLVGLLGSLYGSKRS